MPCSECGRFENSAKCYLFARSSDNLPRPGRIVGNVFTKLAHSKLKKVASPLTSPLSHNLGVIGIFEQLVGTIQDLNFHCVTVRLKYQERRVA